jgi:hypothetical protein
MSRLALSLVLALVPCGFCFAQRAPQHAAPRQVSNGACSVNAINVNGGVTVTFTGPTCGGLSNSDTNLILYLAGLIQSDIDVHKSATMYPFLPGQVGGSITAFSAANADGLTLPSTQNSCSFPNSAAPFGIASSAAFPEPSTIAGSTGIIALGSPNTGFSAVPMTSVSSIIAGTNHLPPFLGSSDLTSIVHVVGSSGYPAGLVLPPSSIDGTTFDSLSPSITKTPLGIVSVLTGADSTPPYRTLTDLTSGADLTPSFANVIAAASSIHGPSLDPLSISSSNSVPNLTFAAADIGVQHSDGLTLPGTSPTGIVFDPSIAQHIVGLNSVPTGTDHLPPSAVVPDLTPIVAGTRHPPDSIFSGASNPSLALESVSMTFTNTSASLGSTTITGMDYPSLSKSLADLQTNGHVITGWTITYLATGSH